MALLLKIPSTIILLALGRVIGIQPISHTNWLYMNKIWLYGYI